jgi:hypothetical protein
VSLEIVAVEVQIGEGIIPTMTPPNVSAPSQIARKTRSSCKSPPETTTEEHAFTQTEGIVDVDMIPSPQIEPVSATLVEEEMKTPTMAMMDIDSHNSAQDQDQLTRGNSQQLPRAKKPKNKWC